MLPLQPDAPKKPATEITRCIAISSASGSATIVALNSEAGSQLRVVLSDARVPKSIHDYKTAIHALAPAGIAIDGLRHDSRLDYYPLEPTSSTERLPRIALPRFK